MSIRTRCLFVLMFVYLLAHLTALPLVGSEGRSRKSKSDKKPALSQPVKTLSDDHIRQQLKSRTSLSIGSIPLQAAVDLLSEKLQVPVIIDRSVLHIAGIDPAAKIVFEDFRNISVSSLLNHVLRPLDLTYVVRDGVICLTSGEADLQLSTRVYPVDDLISFANPLWPEYQDADSLIEAIETTIEPYDWDAVGGIGSIDVHRGNLVISQYDSIQVQIERWLAAVRSARQQIQQYRDQAPRVASVSTQDEATQAVYAALDRTFALQPGESTLRAFAEWVQREFNINVVIDRTALEDFGLDPDTSVVTLVEQRGSLQQMLNLVLRSLELTWTIYDEAIVITTLEDAETRMHVRVYPTADLLSNPAAAGKLVDDQSSGAGERLAELLQRSIAPDSWEYVGGPATIVSHPQIDVLIVGQTPQNHHRIEDLLRRLRDELQIAKQASEDDDPFVAVSELPKEVDPFAPAAALAEQEDPFGPAAEPFGQPDPFGGGEGESDDPFGGGDPFAAPDLVQDAGASDPQLLIVYFVPTRKMKGDVVIPLPGVPAYMAPMGGPPVVGQRKSSAPRMDDLAGVPAQIEAQFSVPVVPVGNPQNIDSIAIPEDQLLGILIELIGPQTWSDTGDCYAKILPGRLVIRQAAPVHRRIHQLLDQMAVPYYTTPDFPRPTSEPSFPRYTQGMGGGMF